MINLINNVLANSINELISADEYGVLISNLSRLDVLYLANELNHDKKKISFYLIGVDESEHANYEFIANDNISISFSVEDAENDRNNGDESIFRVIVIKGNDIQKTSSLEWFNKITLDDVYRLSCKYVYENLKTTNSFISSFISAIKSNDIKRVLNFEDTISFLEKLLNCNENELPTYIEKNLYLLGMCSDRNITVINSTEKIKSRLKDNKVLVNIISDLEKAERISLNRYANDNPSDDTPKLILEFYKRKDKNILAKIDFEKASLCFKKASSSGGSGKKPRYDKISPTAFGAKMVFDNQIDKIKNYLNTVSSSFDGKNGNKIEKKCDLINDDCEVETSIKYESDSVALIDSYVSDERYGCVFNFDAESPSDAISKANKYDPIYLDYESFKTYVFDLIEAYKCNGCEISIDIALKDFIECRKKIIPFKERLNDYAMLQVIDQFELFATYLKTYEKLLLTIENDYRIMAEVEPETIKDIIGYIMAMDFVYFISSENDYNIYAIPTSVNVLYLWKYIQLAQEILDSRNISNEGEVNFLTDKDKEFIIRKSEDIPIPLTLFCVPGVITGLSSLLLPLNGNMGVLPVYSAKQLIDDSYSNIGDMTNLMTKYVALYTHSSLNLKLAFVNPPSVDLVARVINNFNYDGKYEYTFDVTIIRTRASSRNWVTIEEETYNAGLFGKIKNSKDKTINIKVIDKELKYEEFENYIDNNKHIIFMFDPNEKKVEMASNNLNIHISPLCVPKVYEYNPITNGRKISTADSETIFSLYVTIIEKVKEQVGASLRHTKVFTYTPLNEETYHKLLNKTDWMVIFDKNLKIWDVALNSNSEKLFFAESDTRSVGVYSKNCNKLIKGYSKLLKDLGNFFPNNQGITDIINNIRMVNNDGLLSIVSKTTNNVFDRNQGKGSLGLAVTTNLYRQKYPDSIIVGLDTQLARVWLSGRENSILPDLVAIRVDNNEFIVDIIEVKSYDAYSLSGTRIGGHCVEQVDILEDLLKEMFGKTERITTIARREILREQVYDYIFTYIVPKERPSVNEGRRIQDLLKNINKLFTGDARGVEIRKNVSHVSFTSNDSSVLLCNRKDDTARRDILLNIIDAYFITKIVTSHKLSPGEIPFFDFVSAGVYKKEIITDEFKHGDLGSDRQEDNGIKHNFFEEENGGNQTTINDYKIEKNVTSEYSVDNVAISFKKNEVKKDLIENNCKNLYTILKDYGIKVKQIDPMLVQVTSRFYRFKVELYSGETIRSIEKYKDDISRGLEAQGPIMISNIPGTRYIAIDVCYDLNPAPLPLTKYLNILDSYHGKLDILAGESVDGNFKVIDLGDAVHMLVAGTTGSGKTLFLYSLICSLLYKNDSNDLDFIFVDPKQTDFVFFEHLSSCHDKKIITVPEEAINMIRWINEVERPRRVKMFKECKARDIISYNSKNPNNKMKRIILIIDEYADLVRTADNLGIRKEFENSLGQVAAMVRSIGIHIILATQWASASIVTSGIKANFPYRISFKLPQHQDSLTILDRTGAEDLLGKGDMLILDNGVLTRIQSCYIDADNELSDFLKQYE